MVAAAQKAACHSVLPGESRGEAVINCLGDAARISLGKALEDRSDAFGETLGDAVGDLSGDFRGTGVTSDLAGDRRGVCSRGSGVVTALVGVRSKDVGRVGVSSGVALRLRESKFKSKSS